MNIKQAKEEIKHTVMAYLSKDEQGEYRIPVIRQRPILLMGPPGIGKTQIMEQSPWSVRSVWSLIRSRIIQTECSRTSNDKRGIFRWNNVSGHGVYHE